MHVVGRMVGYMAERLENIRESGVEPGTATPKCHGARGDWRCLPADFGQEDSKSDLLQKNKCYMCDGGGTSQICSQANILLADEMPVSVNQV